MKENNKSWGYLLWVSLGIQAVILLIKSDDPVEGIGYVLLTAAVIFFIYVVFIRLFLLKRK